MVKRHKTKLAGPDDPIYKEGVTVWSSVIRKMRAEGREPKTKDTSKDEGTDDREK